MSRKDEIIAIMKNGPHDEYWETVATEIEKLFEGETIEIKEKLHQMTQKYKTEKHLLEKCKKFLEQTDDKLNVWRKLTR